MNLQTTKQESFCMYYSIYIYIRIISINVGDKLLKVRGIIAAMGNNIIISVGNSRLFCNMYYIIRINLLWPYGYTI